MTTVRRKETTGAPIRLASSSSCVSRAQCHSFSMPQRCRTRLSWLWGGPDSGDEQVCDAGGALVGGLRRDQLNDAGAGLPGFFDVIGWFLGPQFPAGVTARP